MRTRTVRPGNERSVWRDAALGAVCTVMASGLLLGMAGTATASPVPGIPLTTVKLCTDGGGKVGPGPAGSQLCNGGGDGGDVIISDPAADALVRTKPKPANPQPDPPKPDTHKPAPPKPAPPQPAHR